MMEEQKISEENIENDLVYLYDPPKHLQSNQYQDLFFEIRHTARNKICLFSISVKFCFWFIYKTMTKQTLYLNNVTIRKSVFRLQFLRQSAF